MLSILPKPGHKYKPPKTLVTTESSSNKMLLFHNVVKYLHELGGFCYMEVSKLIFLTRVESGSNDLDDLGHLGHFFDGSSGSHPQTKLFECDLDITCYLENNVGM